MHTVAVLVGSLRKESANLKLARALQKLAAPHVEFRFLEIGDLPIYNDDLWANPPQSVLRLKADITACDGFLMVTPEYNRGVPAVLKNAFDWGTRPSGQNVWNGKPAALVGAASGAVGTAVAQSHLRNSLLALGVLVMGRPELHFQFRPGIIGEDGEIFDETARKILTTWTEQFVGWIKRFAG